MQSDEEEVPINARVSEELVSRPFNTTIQPIFASTLLNLVIDILDSF